MAKTIYKLFDPVTRQYVPDVDGSIETVSDASPEKIEEFAAKNNLQVEYVQTEGQSLIPQPTGEEGGVVMSPTEVSAAQITPLGAAAGGFLTGLSLNLRDKIFGKDEETGVLPQEAEKMASPGMYKAGEIAGSLASNIAADIGIAAATKGKLGATGTAALGGALTGLIQGAAEGPEGTPVSERIKGGLTSAATGALGGVIGEKVAGPIIKKGASYIKSLLPTFGTPKFPTDVTEKTIEKEMETTAKEAEQEMLKKGLSETGIARRREKIEKLIKPQIEEAKAVQTKMVEEAAPKAFEQQKELAKLELTKSENARLKELVDKKDAAAAFKTSQGLLKMGPAKAKEYLMTKGNLSEEEAIKKVDELIKSSKEPVGFKTGEGKKKVAPEGLTAAEKKELQELAKKEIAFTNAKSVFERESTSRALDLFGQSREELYQSGVEIPEFSPDDIVKIMKKPLKELNPDELYTRINKLESRNLNQLDQIADLETAIKKSDTTIADKKRLFDELRNKLVRYGNLEDYLKRFKSSALGGAIGTQAGVEAGEYMTTPSGVKRGSL